MNRILSSLRFVALGIFLLWPFLIPFLSWHREKRKWLQTWRVGLSRPDLMIAVGRGPYTQEDAEKIVAPLVHFFAGNYIYNYANYDDFRIDDKAQFATLCEAHKIPCVPTLRKQDIENEKIYIRKPRREGQGRGIRKILGRDALTELDRDDVVIQDLLSNHPLLIALVGPNAALSTIRIITIQGSRHEIKVFGSFLRLGRQGALVDNLSQGGIAVPISNEGLLMKAATYESLRSHWSNAFELTHHPDTKQQIEGIEVSFYSEVKTLVTDAHRKLCPHMGVCAWDVHLGTEGPALVEGASYLGGGTEFTMTGKLEDYIDAVQWMIENVELLRASKSKKKPKKS